MSQKSKRLSHIAGGVAAVVAVMGAAMPIIRSDASPWASVLRVESVRSEILAMHITLTWSSYCQAARLKNALAMQAVMDDINDLEQQFARLNDGRELPLRPCP
jgi:hypothetical protein